MDIYKRLLLIVLSVLLLVIPVFLLCLWFYVCSRTNGYPDSRMLFNDYLPHFLTPRYATNLFSLPFCVAAIVLNTRNLHTSAKWLRLFSWIVVILGSFLAFANLWSMM